MTFQKGMSKTGGRKKGVPNKKTVNDVNNNIKKSRDLGGITWGKDLKSNKVMSGEKRVEDNNQADKQPKTSLERIKKYLLDEIDKKDVSLTLRSRLIKDLKVLSQVEETKLSKEYTKRINICPYPKTRDPEDMGNAEYCGNCPADVNKKDDSIMLPEKENVNKTIITSVNKNGNVTEKQEIGSDNKCYDNPPEVIENKNPPTNSSIEKESLGGLIVDGKR